MFSREIFSHRLIELRKEKNESQETLAKLLNVKRTQISEMENGRRTTTIEKLARICEHYNVSADYLLGLTEERRALTMETSAETYR